MYVCVFGGGGLTVKLFFSTLQRLCQCVCVSMCVYVCVYACMRVWGDNDCENVTCIQNECGNLKTTTAHRDHYNVP